MDIPVYVVTGFLDAGKTSLLNNILNQHNWHNVRTLVIQFESGEEDFQSQHGNCDTISFPKKLLEQKPEEIAPQMSSCIQNNEFDEIWVEWNGVVPYAQLQDMLLQPSLRKLCHIQKVFHVANASDIEDLLTRTGGILPEQISNCDFAVVRGVKTSKDFKKIKRLLNGINSGIHVYTIESSKDLYKQLVRKRDSPISFFMITILWLVALYIAVTPLLENMQIPVNKITNVFLGIILQAIPFLLIGVLLSSAIHVFIPQSFIERRFPKSAGLGMVVAIICGFCLPVCDCASIPIFRGLVKKGVPLPAAVTFMTASPVINPVVILSTYYAFSGNMSIVVNRVCMGIISSIIIGLIIGIFPPKGHVLSGGVLDRLMCSCGCYEDIQSVTTFRGKMNLFIRHSQAEFFSVGKYLVIGTFISSIFQVIGTGMFTTAKNSTNLAVTIVIMMAIAFVLSLCSSSDAVVARSFANIFPTSAIMGFLVFGPMMDIKNVMMLSAGFSKRFILRLLFTVFIACFAVVFIFSGLGGL